MEKFFLPLFLNISDDPAHMRSIRKAAEKITGEIQQIKLQGLR